MAVISVPDAGSPDAGYPAPTPHAAAVAHEVYAAPSDMPSGNPAPAAHAGFEAIDGLGEAKEL